MDIVIHYQLHFYHFQKQTKHGRLHKEKILKIKIVNLPTKGSEAKGIDTSRQKSRLTQKMRMKQRASMIPISYEMVDWSSNSSQQNKLGLFDAKQVNNFAVILKLRDFMKTQKSNANMDEIMACFEKHEITKEYFETTKRQAFVTLLKQECKIKGGLSIKIWNLFKKKE